MFFINCKAVIVSADAKMAQMDRPSEASIISIIREMVQAGEPEENIIKSLKELGITEKDAKKLLLLGEADTFSLLQSEINKMVKEKGGGYVRTVRNCFNRHSNMDHQLCKDRDGVRARRDLQAGKGAA